MRNGFVFAFDLHFPIGMGKSPRSGSYCPFTASDAEYVPYNNSVSGYFMNNSEIVSRQKRRLCRTLAGCMLVPEVVYACINTLITHYGYAALVVD